MLVQYKDVVVNLDRVSSFEMNGRGIWFATGNAEEVVYFAFKTKEDAESAFEKIMNDFLGGQKFLRLYE